MMILVMDCEEDFNSAPDASFGRSKFPKVAYPVFLGDASAGPKSSPEGSGGPDVFDMDRFSARRRKLRGFSGAITFVYALVVESVDALVSDSDPELEPESFSESESNGLYPVEAITTSIKKYSFFGPV
jgi:hypothetical protein